MPGNKKKFARAKSASILKGAVQKPSQVQRKVKFAKATHGEDDARRVLDLEDKDPFKLTEPALKSALKSARTTEDDSDDDVPLNKLKSPRTLQRNDTFFDSKLPNKVTEQKAAELDLRLNEYVKSWITMKPVDGSIESVIIWSLEQHDFILPDNIDKHFLELVQKRKAWNVVKLDEMAEDASSPEDEDMSDDRITTPYN